MLAMLVQYARTDHLSSVWTCLSVLFSLLIEHFGHVLIEIIVALLMTNSIFSLISLFSLS